MIVLLTGPPAAGKNTVAASLARRLDRIAVIDDDVVRGMVVQPHHAPWEGSEGHAQQVLGVRNACTLAREFVANGYDVLVLDVVTERTAALYRRELDLAIVRLLPDRGETDARSETRSEGLLPEERRMLYGQQQAFRGADLTIDNTILSPDTVADELRQLLVSDNPGGADG